MEQIFITILLYSLGLGLILALMTGLTLILTRTSSPLLRYRILVFLLASFALGTVTIGFRAIESATEASQTVSRGTEKTFHIQQDNNSPAQVSIFKQGYHLLNSNSRIIALIWLLIVVIKSIKLGSNLLELHYLKTRKIFPAGEYWETRLEQLSKKIGLNKTVKIMQSGIIQVPVVIGHFKPVILIPLGMITAIKPQEIEMMLLHELAHIKRMDFLANMMQHILELLFFFNPAVLWTSALIRKERENCCDEMVLQSAASKQSYIQALLSFKEYQLRVPAYAMAF
ncbi:MAG TPA: M56 family metallopeptidase, partial [Pedobacter sp.]|nr:M56 family metallopeptidase [Pedobacter sp.]